MVLCGERVTNDILSAKRGVRKFVKICFLLIAVALSTLGQTASQTLPTTWAGAGASYNSAASPAVTGWGSYARILSQQQALYSYSSYDVILADKKLSTSARTGVAAVIRSLPIGKAGTIYVLGFGQAGVATSSTNTTTASFSGGGIALWQIKRSPFTFEAIARQQKNGDTNVTVYEIGFGRTW